MKTTLEAQQYVALVNVIKLWNDWRENIFRNLGISWESLADYPPAIKEAIRLTKVFESEFENDKC